MEERTIQDLNRWNNGMIGKVFYQICPDNNRYYRTIRIHHNPFTNHLQPQISNAVMGLPPDGMEPINPLLLTRLMRMSHTPAPFF